MQKLIFGIFAHPDDEAFGVSPTLLKETAEGAQVHLVTLTAGENGTNPDNHENLGEVRLAEWRRGGELMGAASMHHLGYIDGTLCNQNMLEISGKIQKIVEDFLPLDDFTSVEFISFDENGLSGHIDHIVATRAALHAFYSLKQRHEGHMARIRLRCIPESVLPAANIDWLYMNAGKRPEEIDEIVDATAYHDTILEVIRAHHSQRVDAEAHILNAGENLGMNYFIVKE